jgi:hypothetical protein
MATLKGRAQQRLFAAKKRVQIAPLSVGDVNAIAFTVFRGSSSTLLRTALESKAGKDKHPDSRVFSNAITAVVNHRKGSLYAALVTSIDTKGVFHPDQFATSVARLGVVDDIKAKLAAENYGSLGDLIATKAPFFWADMISREITTVRKEVSNFMGRLFARFHESVDTETADELLESALLDTPLASMTPKAQLMRGALELTMPGQSERAFLNLFRTLAQTQRMGLLNPNSSLEATFETFHQHLMTNPSALQQLIPRAKFGGKVIPPSKLQRMFRDQQLVKRLRLSFKDAYDKTKHDVQIDRLYRSMKRQNVHGEIARVGRTLLNMKLSENSISAIVSGVVGLFFAFAGDTKGTSFPQMRSIKG